MIELACCTWFLLQEIRHKHFHQKDVAFSYALAMRSTEATDWKQVNAAIIKRWSVSGLKRVKAMAWKKLEYDYGNKICLPHL